MKIALLSILIIGTAILIAAKQKGNPINEFLEENFKKKISGSEFVEKLDSLGFFKYAEEEHRVSLKTNLIENFDPENELVSIWDDETSTPLDYRYYFCDGETVFEQGGFTEMLDQMKPTFQKLGFKLTIENHFEEWDDKNQWLNHRITINRTEYVIFKNFKDYGWGEAVRRLAEILNMEFAKQEIKERIYLVSGGNDGRLIYLTDELYEYIYQVYTNPMWKPLEVKEWAKVMGVGSMRIE